MTLEDFTLYTEIDPNNHIDAAAHHVDYYSLLNETCYLYDDKGVDHFGDFEHLVDGLVDTNNGASSEGACWALSNVLGDFDDIKDVAGKYITVSFYGRQVIRLQYFDGANWHNSNYPCSLDTWYYLTIERSGTTLTCKIYSDADRTTLLSTESLTDVTADPFRYIYAANSRNTGIAWQATIDVENLDLQEVPPPAAVRSFATVIDWARG